MASIPLRTFQRSTQAFTDLIEVNPSEWFPVVDGMGTVLFYACKDPTVRQPSVLPDRDKPSKAEAFQALKASLDVRDDAFGPSLAAEELREDQGPVSPEDFCQKCKKPSELYEYEEEGLEYKVCAMCALKAKNPMSSMKKL